MLSSLKVHVTVSESYFQIQTAEHFSNVSGDRAGDALFGAHGCPIQVTKEVTRVEREFAAALRPQQICQALQV